MNDNTLRAKITIALAHNRPHQRTSYDDGFGPIVHVDYRNTVDAIILAFAGDLSHLAADLRHAYAQLNAETVVNQKEFANGLIAPAIRVIEALSVAQK